MNKLLFSEGGQPIHLDDIAFLQESSQKIIQAIYASVGNCILWGVHIETAGYVSCEPGAVLYEGKVYEVREPKVIEYGMEGYGMEDIYWDFREYKSDSKIFEDGQERPTRVYYTAEILVSKKPLEGKVPVTNTPALYERPSFRKPLATVKLTSNYLTLIDCVILSRFSAVLSLRIDRPFEFDKVLGNIEVEMDKVNWHEFPFFKQAEGITGEARIPGSGTMDKNPISLEIESGKLYYRRNNNDEPVDQISSIRGMVTVLISWDLGGSMYIE